MDRKVSLNSNFDFFFRIFPKPVSNKMFHLFSAFCCLFTFGTLSKCTNANWTLGNDDDYEHMYDKWNIQNHVFLGVHIELLQMDLV